MNVLISSAGRRVSLIGLFQKAGARVVAIDADPLAPASRFADKFHRVPRCDEWNFGPTVERICASESIDLIVPIIDAELPFYSERVPSFGAAGIEVAVSSPEVVALAEDKVQTHSWLTSEGFPVPRRYLYPGENDLPLIVKPRRGASSIGVEFVRTGQALGAVLGKPDLVFEDLLGGPEYTVNVYVDRAGRVKCAIPHRRLAVRGGEVSRAVTERRADVVELATAIAERLPGARGPINVQLFATQGEQQGEGLRVTEINARFSGGYPLADRAGARFPRRMIAEATGQPLETELDAWRDGVAMARYDEEIFSEPADLAFAGAAE